MNAASQDGVSAVIDCGSHSTRLLIAQNNGSRPKTQYKTLHKDMRITRLGEGVSNNGLLGADAIQRTLECIKDYMAVLKDYESKNTVKINQLCIVATAAARFAKNSQEFFEEVQKLTSVRPVLLEGRKEAELAFLGAVSQLKSNADNLNSSFLTIDIGGGSTDFGFGSRECEKSVSLPIGCVNLTEEFISRDPPAPEELHSCLSVVEAHLSDLVQEIPSAGSASALVGMAGTVTTAAAVELGFYDPEAVHHFKLTKPMAEDVFRTLSTEPRQQRIQNPGLHPERVDVIAAGLCILIKTMRFFDFQECLVSEADLLDGIFLEMCTN